MRGDRGEPQPPGWRATLAFLIMRTMLICLCIGPGVYVAQRRSTVAGVLVATSVGVVTASILSRLGD